ncbi:MAG: immunity 70 family protein [Caldisphaeraceae archaeon]|nr:immunity 70 family protein [Caldisphaeraceae archaeon]
MSITIVNQEKIREEILKAMNVEKYDIKKVERELETVRQALAKLSPEKIILNDFLLLKVELTKIASYIIVLPEKFTLKAIDSMKILEKLSEFVKDDKYVLFVFYSRKGRLTTCSYLYLGDLMEALDIGILFVNGSTDEIIQVLDILESKGRFVLEEEKAIEFDF